MASSEDSVSDAGGGSFCSSLDLVGSTSPRAKACSSRSRSE